MSYEDQWQEHYGIDRDPVRENLIYPMLFDELGSLESESIIDLGCGNGGLIHRLSNLSFSSATGLDRSDAFLESAQMLSKDPRVRFISQDLTKPLSTDLPKVDRIVSVFVLNELASLLTFFSLIQNLLKSNGHCHLVFTHPFLVLKEALQSELLGIPSRKLVGELSYWGQSRIQYNFTLVQATANFYQHTFQEILNTAKSNSLELLSLLELRTNAPEFEGTPYWEERDIPKYVYLKLKKN